MRAWRVHEHGAPSEVMRLEQGEAPEPGEGQVRLRVHAAALNLPDDRLCRGTYILHPEFPFTPGLEAAGIIDAVGPGVETDLIDRRVVCVADLPYGSLAESAIGLVEGLYRVPDDQPFADAAAFLIAFQTGHVALLRRGQLRAGETLLVHAGAGGVGSAAIQLGKLFGARVIATAGGPEKVQLCRDLGADLAIDYRSVDFREAVMEFTDGRGVDVIYDAVSGDIFHQSRRCLASEGRLLVVGFASGDIAQLPTNHALLKNYSVVGVHMGAYLSNTEGREYVHEIYDELLQWYRERKIKPVIGQHVSMDDVPQAIEALATRQTVGKVIVDVADSQ